MYFHPSGHKYWAEGCKLVKTIGYQTFTINSKVLFYVDTKIIQLKLKVFNDNPLKEIVTR